MWGVDGRYRRKPLNPDRVQQILRSRETKSHLTLPKVSFDLGEPARGSNKDVRLQRELNPNQKT